MLKWSVRPRVRVFSMQFDQPVIVLCAGAKARGATGGFVSESLIGRHIQ